jgi:hypothetical protein
MTWDFTIFVRIMGVGIFLTESSVGLAATGGVPKYNIDPTCVSPGRQAIALGNSSIDACKRSEIEARGLLTENWSHYPKDEKTNCTSQVTQGGHPSYIELHTCLEAFRHARAIRHARHNGASQKSKRAKGKL